MQQKSKFLKRIVHVLDQVEAVRSHDAVDRGNADGLLHLPDGRQVLRISGITPLAPLSPLCMILYILYCIVVLIRLVSKVTLVNTQTSKANDSWMSLNYHQSRLD